MGNNTQRPNYPQILEIPPGLTPPQFQALIADRIKDLNVLIKGLECNPSVVDLAMANFRITGLADPTDDLDAVNLRTLRRQGGGSTQVAATATSSGLDAYTIVYNVPGFIGPDESVPAFIVGKNRTGRPAEGWVYALGAPSVAAVTFNFTQNGTSLLVADATLPLDSNGPVFTTNLAGGLAFKHGDVIELVITGGSASGLSFGLVVERS